MSTLTLTESIVNHQQKCDHTLKNSAGELDCRSVPSHMRALPSRLLHPFPGLCPRNSRYFCCHSSNMPAPWRTLVVSRDELELEHTLNARPTLLPPSSADALSWRPCSRRRILSHEYYLLLLPLTYQPVFNLSKTPYPSFLPLYLNLSERPSVVKCSGGVLSVTVPGEGSSTHAFLRSVGTLPLSSKPRCFAPI